ncbi:glycosyltransferase [Terracoccus sp. 273MFTsu3.1]|uniref:glycosyltransferase n=1 Tax=Terracoccus sp. 273MFTsu3.1 TaxID=1172188 RepID=UPI000363B65B|nr:glycosyltransferase [Terracoccus sp. 273MFTsu3.1]
MRDLSVVVSAHASCDRVAACLGALAAQTLPAEAFEVVVVLHGPGSSARDAVERVARGPLAGHEVELVDAVAHSPGAARNGGVGLARAPWTTFVDGTDVVAPTHLERLYAVRHPERIVVSTTSAGDDASRHVAPHLAPAALRGRGGRLYPTRWLVDTPFVEDLCGSEDTVLHGQLLSRFDRQFTELDLTPGPPAAQADPPAAALAIDPDTAVRAHLSVLTALTTGTQADPADRTAVTNALTTAELADLRQVGELHPGGPAHVEAALRGAGIPGITSLGPTHVDGTADGFGLFHTPPSGARSLVVVAGSAGSVNEHARMLGFLARSGHGIRVLHYRGRLQHGLRKLPETHRVEVLPASLGWIEARVTAGAPRRRRIALRASQEGLRLGRRAIPELVPARLAAPAFGRVDTRAGALLAEPGTRVVLDRAGSTLLRAWGDDSPAVGAHELAGLVLSTAASQLRGSLADAHAARAASRLLRGEAVRTRVELDPELWTMVIYRLLRAGRLEAATALLDDREALFGSLPHPALGALHAVLTGVDPSTVDVVDAARVTLRHTDDALADGDLDRAAFLTTVALDLLFTRRLHTAETRSAIVSEPDTFLAPLRETEVGRLLGRRTTSPTQRLSRQHPTDVDRPRVTVLPGAYPKFAGAVVAGLGDRADVEVLDLSARQKRFANTGVDPVTVRERLLAATGHPPALDLATAEALSADVVFVDWADKGLTWLTQVVPEGTRVVVRLHGVDTLSAWLHTAEWDKVDDVIFPSDHLRRAAAAALGGRLDGIRQHVVANPVDVERYVLPKTEAARTTLGMVGWAQQVKDPLWTLDVLAALRRQDPRWRLRLIGKDFAVDDPNPVEREAARAFHARLSDPLVADGVDFVGYTTRLPEHLREVGWAVSSSRREGFHIGLVEMAASGAVPVVRDWPVYAGIGGATGLFPADWVSTTPAEAAERILRVSGSGTWDDASGRTVDTVRDRFSGTDSAERLRRIVLGER